MNAYVDNGLKSKTPATENISANKINGGSTVVQLINNRRAPGIQLKQNHLVDNRSQTLQKKENKTGLPDNLKTGIENLSGYAMDDVKVHRNSDKPAQLNAHAYAQGSEIHIAPGQEKHLPHEAWHVAQQKQGRVKPTLQMKSGIPVNDDKGLEHEADKMGGRAISIQAPVVQPQKNSLPETGVVQRVLHKGTTMRSEEYQNAVALGKFSRSEVKKFIDAPEHYGYNKAKNDIVEIKPKEKKDNKRKRSSDPSDTDTEFKGWMKEVDEGVESFNKTGVVKVNFKARELKDAGSKGFKVGINNIANIKGMEETGEVEMTETQQRLNFFANHLMTSIIDNDDDGYTTSDEKADRRKKRKAQIGPEVQQIISTKDGELHTHVGGNSQKAQEMLRKELLLKKGKRRKLKDYHRKKYRETTIQQSIKQMESILASAPKITGMITKAIAEKKSNDEISQLLKAKIGNKYKNEQLKYLFRLRNSLKAKYGSSTLGDAVINVPDNTEEIHAESNLLEAVIGKFKILDVMGTKVPCVACFAKFCQKKQQAHLLQYTSSIWFSKPCMNQLGCDFSAQSANEVLNYLNEIDLNLRSVIANIKKYTGNMGDIKMAFDDDDSDSMGEESRQSIIDKYR